MLAAAYDWAKNRPGRARPPERNGSRSPRPYRALRAWRRTADHKVEAVFRLSGPALVERDPRPHPQAVLDRHGWIVGAYRDQDQARRRGDAGARAAGAAHPLQHPHLPRLDGRLLHRSSRSSPFCSCAIRSGPFNALADAADRFGRGRPAPPDFKVRGAREVRLAAQAFLEMRDRIERHVEQRTIMLAGVSHDLRTILTRFRLQLAMMQAPSYRGLKRDVDEMQEMLEDYMAFAKGRFRRKDAAGECEAPAGGGASRGSSARQDGQA